MDTIEELPAKITQTESAALQFFIAEPVQLALFAEQNNELPRNSCGVTDSEKLD